MTGHHMSRGPSAKKESWGTRVGVILAVTGSAVGLGNFLRFPGLATKYGGGAFMIPYAVAFLLLGLPIAFSEWSMGRLGGRRGYNSLPGIFRSVWGAPLSPYAGVLGLLIPVIIYMYYVFIESWCLAYAWYYLSGRMAQMSADPGVQMNQVIDGLISTGQDGGILSSSSNPMLVFLLICFLVNFVLIYRGLNKGIEWFCKWAMPALVVCALIVLGRVLTLPAVGDNADRSVLNGLGFMWNPYSEDKSIYETLSNMEVWLAAAGQIFFSLSVGFGIIITYASYLKNDDDVALSSLTASAGNGFCEVSLGGMILIPAAFVLIGSEQIQQADGSTFKLGFKVLPMVFETMPGGRYFGFLFFFLLFLAAVTSSLSMLQPAIAFLEEGLGLNRKASVTFLGFITVVGTGFVVFFTKGLVALDSLDFWVGSVAIYILATVQVIVYGWVLGVDKGFEELDRGSEIRIPRFVKYIIKYIAPVYLLIVFIGWAIQQLPTRIENIGQVELMALGLILIVTSLFLLLIVQAVKRWDQRDLANTEVSP